MKKALSVACMLGVMWFSGVASAEVLEDDTTFIADDTEKVLITLQPVYMSAGQMIYLWSSFRVKGPDPGFYTNYNVKVAGKVYCTCDKGGTTDPEGVWSTRNWEGYDAQPTGVKQKIRAMLEAPVAGYYTCKLSVYAGSSAGSPAMTAVGGLTSLKMATPVSGAGWTTEETYYEPGYSGYVLRYSYHGNTSSEKLAVADLEVTTCNNGTGNCDEEHHGTSSGTTVKTQLKVVQLNANGTPCTSWSLDPSSPLTTFVSNNAHHQKIYHDIIVDRIAPPNNGCVDKWAIKLHLNVVSGNPIKIEDWTGGPVYYSNGVARDY